MVAQKDKSKSKSQNRIQNKHKNKICKQREIEKKKRKRKKTTLIVFAITTLAVCLGTYLSISPTYKIQKILIKGNEQLTKEKIQEIAEINIGDNILFKSKKVLEVKLKQNGGIEKVKIKKIYPNSIEIEITERKTQFQVKTENEKYIYIDEQGYIIDCSNDKGDFPTIIGMGITEVDSVNKKRLEGKDLSKMENILQIQEECKKIEIANKITQIQVEEEYVIKLENEGISINFGDVTDLKNRMYYVSAILKQEAGNKGTIYVNGNLNEGFFPYFSAN